MDVILDLATRHGISVVEDNAHGLFGAYRGKPLGTFGCLAAQSFHETKNINCGEGGALLINDPRLAERAEIIREKGTNRSRFFRGLVDKYTWVDVGSSVLTSRRLPLCAAGARERIRPAATPLGFRHLRDWAAARTSLPSVGSPRAGVPHVLSPAPVASNARR
jgi:dTDP-4-amino-4,6-dideoxygalactose transaminase